MSNLEVCLITFIVTGLFIVKALDISAYCVDKETVKKSKVITFNDGSIWKKVDSIGVEE